MSKQLMQCSFMLLLLPFLIACGQQNETQLQQEITQLKLEVKKLNEDVANIGSQVNDIHEVAMNSQKPKKAQNKVLPTLSNFSEDGQIPMIGDAQAQLAIIEFSDYQCPYCKRFMDATFPKIKTDYVESGKVKYLTRDFPLAFHKQAQGAAIAANCSLQQNAYWPMRAALFKNVKKLGDPLYQKTAIDLSLNMDEFIACQADKTMVDRIAQDIAFGKSLGIRGTPSFVVGRIENDQLVDPQLVVGAQSYETFVLLLDELLAKAP